MREAWIAANVVNCLALFIGILIGVYRLSLADYAKREDHPRQSVNLMRDRNVWVAREMVVINAALFLLGFYLILVALVWTAPVPAFVPIGTGAFMLIWVGWTAREIVDARRMARISRVREKEYREGMSGL